MKRAMKAVFWSFFGVRKGRDYDEDASNLSPVQVIIAGIISTIIFVVALIVLVNWITS